MDRFFLQALVREVAPRIVGKRVRGVTRWGRGCFTLEMATRPRTGLVISLLPEASVFFVGNAPVSARPDKSAERFKKLLTGAELVEIEAKPFDRVVRFNWRRARASGVEQRLELIVEWAGTRTGAYLVDPGSREILDILTSGNPRHAVGSKFQPLKPPPGAGPVAPGSGWFRERLDEARREGFDVRVAARIASGLSPLLVDEMLRRQSGEGLSLEESFDTVTTQLTEQPAPVVLRPKKGFRTSGSKCLLSPIALRPRLDWTEVRHPSFNEAAMDFFQQATRLKEEKRRYGEIRASIRHRLKKQRQRLNKLRRDKESLVAPALMRRWGELLLAGHQDAKRLDGEVELPDIYDPAGGTARVPIEPHLDLIANAERYFHRARRTERSLENMEIRLGRLLEEIQYLELLSMELEDATESEDFEAVIGEVSESGIPPSVQKPKKPKGRRSRTPALRRFRGSGGGLILVGRTGRSNEELTFEVAQPGDLWLHAADVAGAHVVLRRDPKGSHTQEEIEEAAALAAYFSKARGSNRVEVIYTPRRYVRKIPSTPPGTVRVSQFETVRVRPGLVQEEESF